MLLRLDSSWSFSHDFTIIARSTTKVTDSTLQQPFTRNCILNISSCLLWTLLFILSIYLFSWTACCSAALLCCEDQLSLPPLPPPGRSPAIGRCSRTWDGFSCWPDTLTDTQSVQQCPTYIPHVLNTRQATKHCLPNATWYHKQGMEWTDYTPCTDKQVNTGRYMPSTDKQVNTGRYMPSTDKQINNEILYPIPKKHWCLF